jgi:predicted nucleic acid-binding protein
MSRRQALNPNTLVLLDSSAILAVLDRADQNHAAALRAATELARLRCRLFQSTWLRAETHALLIARVGADPARRWLSSPPPPTVRPDAADEARGETIVERYRDKDFSLCDAVSFALMERLGSRAAFTFDRHFEQYGFGSVP